MKRFSQFARQVIATAVPLLIMLAAVGIYEAEGHPGDAATDADHYEIGQSDEAESMLPATDLSLSLLSFAVGVAACLLVVRAMLPTLVQAHCAEIVRDYLDRTSRDAGMKVLVIDRDSKERSQAVREPHVPEMVGGRSIRVDAPAEFPTQPRRTPQSSSDAGESLLSSIYEQNIDLQSKLRSQAKADQP